MEPNTRDLPQPDDGYQRPWRAIVFIFIGFLIASTAVYGIYRITRSDDNQEATPQTTAAQQVVASDTDEVITEIPQNPSLKLLDEAGTIYVENDGNVTMSGIEVRDAAGAAICDLGTISPGERQPCDGAPDALRPIMAVGSGPQGQPVETSLN